mmetsp:Transcript_31834/g.46298  ORF Transcript_31834/g.46298 Transcript_31834/m.46298 type:complete len:230 (-) Transcript_31834:1042-1731(-)
MAPVSDIRRFFLDFFSAEAAWRFSRSILASCFFTACSTVDANFVKTSITDTADCSPFFSPKNTAAFLHESKAFACAFFKLLMTALESSTNLSNLEVPGDLHDFSRLRLLLRNELEVDSPSSASPDVSLLAAMARSMALRGSEAELSAFFILTLSVLAPSRVLLVSFGGPSFSLRIAVNSASHFLSFPSVTLTSATISEIIIRDTSNPSGNSSLILKSSRLSFATNVITM